MLLKSELKLEGVNKEDLFLFLSDPLNIEKVYPKQLKAKVRKQDDRYSVEIYLLGQFFNFDLIIKETRKYELIIDELRGPLFKKWINVHRIVEKGKELLMIDEIEFETKLGFIGDFFARKVIERIINYRNQSLLKIFGKESNPIFINPLQIDLVKGTSLLAFLTIFALVILILLPLNAIIDLILGLISWVLLWYSAHDLFHLIFGNILGIRFSYYYIGFSNLIRISWIPERIRLLAITFGIKINRKKSKASKLGFAIMYFAGPLASMLMPFIPAIYLLMKHSMIAGYFLLFISLFNLIFTSYFSPKYGCISKGLRVLRK
ncbi:MAG: hypothetical protein RQ952_03785 [Thermoproteota archaeon]|jgi:hypothetical protein|nr:hypothetical protein [Thermoproteota archaeon]